MLSSQTITLAQLAQTIDHALLKPDQTVEDVLAGCQLGIRYQVASICCKPSDVKLCARELDGTGVFVGTVIGFPHGSNHKEVKALEAKMALDDGATELDVVINIGHLRSGLLDEVRADLQAVIEAANGKVVKVILENAYLTPNEIVAGCQLSEQAGAKFVKTSTGYATCGARLEDVRLMRQSVSAAVEVKASGGIRTLESMLELIDAGATRIGTTATAAMLYAFSQGHRESETKGNSSY